MFPLNNGSYDAGDVEPPACTQGICGTVTDAGSGVGQVNVSIKDRTTGKYWGGSAFDQPTQTYNAATVVGNNWSYALAASDLTAPHSYLIEVYSVDNVANSDVHQQIRFTYGSDVGGPASTLTLSSASHAYLTASAPYVLYYGTGNGGGGFTLHQSASDPSGVDTITFPDLSGTSGFSGNGGTATNGSSADPFVSTSSYTFTSSAGTAPAPKNVDSADLRATSPTTRLRSCSTTARRQAAALRQRRQRLLDDDELHRQPRRLHGRRRRLGRRFVRPDGRVRDALERRLRLVRRACPGRRRRLRGAPRAAATGSR